MLTHKTFNQDKYRKTGWEASLISSESDNYFTRLIVRVATGRRYWPIISIVITPELETSDPAIKLIERQLYAYTHPMIERFVSELEVMLSDIYNTQIILNRPQ
jgi:hypothetical protein